MTHSHHTKFPTTENCTANHLVPTNEDPEPCSRSDSSAPKDAVHPAHKMTSDRASTCDITALSDTEEDAEPSPTQASRDDFPRVDKRISDCTQPNLNAANQDVEHSMPDSHIQILETKREPDESSKPLHPMCEELATPNSQLTPEDDIPDLPAADHAHGDPDGPVMVHATDSHIPTTTMAPTNEITHEPIPDDRISSTITSMTQASDPVNSNTPPAETHYIHKLSAAKVEEHQKHAIASWNDIATDIQNISAKSHSYSVLMQNMEGGMSKMKNWLRCMDDPTAQDDNSISLPTQVKQTQPGVFIGLEMHNLVHEQRQDEQYAQQFFEQCGLAGTAHIGPHLNNAKRSGVLFWHRHDLQFTVYHGICTEEGVHSGRPVHHNPNHEGRVLIALGGVSTYTTTT